MTNRVLILLPMEVERFVRLADAIKSVVPGAVSESAVVTVDGGEPVQAMAVLLPEASA